MLSTTDPRRRLEPFPGPDGNAVGAELAGLALAGRTSEGVHLGADFHPVQTGSPKHRFQPCTRQGTGDSAGPQVDVAFGAFGDRTLHADVACLQTATGAQDPHHLAEGRLLVRYQVEHPVRDDEIGPAVG
jgi:hypothetical protein